MLEFLFDKETPALFKRDSTQVFSCEYCEILKNTFFYRTPLVAASAAKSAESESLRIKSVPSFN